MMNEFENKSKEDFSKISLFRENKELSAHYYKFHKYTNYYYSREIHETMICGIFILLM